MDQGAHVPTIQGMNCPDQMSARRGLTVVEIVVAIALLGIGVLALATTSVYVTRSAGESARQAYAALRLATIADSLRATSCARVSSGSGGLNALRVQESWVRRGGTVSGVVGVGISVSWRSPQGSRRRESVEASIPCG